MPRAGAAGNASGAGPDRGRGCGRRRAQNPEQRLLHRLGGGPAGGEVVLQGAVRHGLELGGDRRVELAERALVEGERRFEARVAAGKQVVQGGAEGVQVALRLGHAAVLLGGRVALGADHRALAVRAVQAAGDAEVDQHDAVVGGDHHVGGLHVAEHDWLGLMGVEVAQHVADLNAPAGHLLLVEGLAVFPPGPFRGLCPARAQARGRFCHFPRRSRRLLGWRGAARWRAGQPRARSS